jgi:hypothetical protein
MKDGVCQIGVMEETNGRTLEYACGSEETYGRYPPYYAARCLSMKRPAWDLLIAAIAISYLYPVNQLSPLPGWLELITKHQPEMRRWQDMTLEFQKMAKEMLERHPPNYGGAEAMQAQRRDAQRTGDY